MPADYGGFINCLNYRRKDTKDRAESLFFARTVSNFPVDIFHVQGNAFDSRTVAPYPVNFKRLCTELKIAVIDIVFNRVADLEVAIFYFLLRAEGTFRRFSLKFNLIGKCGVIIVDE